MGFLFLRDFILFLDLTNLTLLIRYYFYIKYNITFKKGVFLIKSLIMSTTESEIDGQREAKLERVCMCV